MANQSTTTTTATANPQPASAVTTIEINETAALPVSSNQPGDFEISGDSVELFSEMVEQSAKMADMKPVLTLSSSYMELNTPGDSFRGVFFGYQTITTKDEETGELREVAAARFLLNRSVVINAGVVLVDECRNARLKEGTPVEVTYARKEGRTKIYTLTLLGRK
jgi:hypothetical protein